MGYEDTLVDVYGADEVWPLIDITAGVAISAHVDGDRDGILNGWDLQNAAGPVEGTFAPLFDETDDGNILTESLKGIFDGDAGGVFICVKVMDWDPDYAGYFLMFYVDDDNLIYIQQHSVANRLAFVRKANGTGQTITVNDQGHAEWFSVALTWDINAGVDGELKAFVNGAQFEKTVNALPEFDSNNLTRAVIGNNNVGNITMGMEGWLAYAAVKFGKAWASQQIFEMHEALSNGGAYNEIEITSPVSYQVFQRNDSDKANIEISGFVRKSGSYAIEASWNSGDYQEIIEEQD